MLFFSELRWITATRSCPGFYRIFLPSGILLGYMRPAFLLTLFILALLIVNAGCTAPGPGSTGNSAPNPTEKSQNPAGPHVSRSNLNQVRTVHVNDIDIAYTDIGQGKPLILINGYGMTMDLWPPGVLTNLSRTHRVIVFDNRGMGNTTASDKPFTIGLFADDVAGLLDALNISQADVLGWSMGAEVAQELALRHPGNVDRLILYAGTSGGKESVPASPAVIEKLTNTSGSARERGERFFSLLFPAAWLREHPDPMAYFPVPTESSNAESYVRQIEAISTWNGTYSRLPGIRSPTLVLTGADDVISVPENAFLIGGRIPGAWVIQVPGGGHGMMYQFPDKFEQIVTFFLES